MADSAQLRLWVDFSFKKFRPFAVGEKANVVADKLSFNLIAFAYKQLVMFADNDRCCGYIG